MDTNKTVNVMYDMKKIVKIFKNSWLEIDEFNKASNMQFFPQCHDIVDSAPKIVLTGKLDGERIPAGYESIEGSSKNQTWWSLLQNINNFEFSMKNFGNIT